MEIINLVHELERLKRTSADIVTPTKLITAIEDGGTVKLDLQTYGKLPLTTHAESQLAEKTGIPIKYFHDMTGAGMADLAAENVNRWLQKQDDNRLIRMADGKIRAVLSDRYRQLDNYDAAFQVMDQAQKHGAKFTDCQLTDTRMYLKLTVPNAEQQVKAGDNAVPGLMVSNSEVGAGAFRVEPFLFRLICSNGLIGTDTLYTVHLGAKLQLGEQLYRDDTLQAIDTASVKQIRDLVAGTFDGKILNRQIEHLRKAENLPIEPGKIQEVLTATAKDLSLSEEHKNDLLRYFAKEGDTVAGLTNGLTRLAQDFTDYDQRVDIERYAGKKLEALVTAK